MLSAERPDEPRLNDRDSPPRGALLNARLEPPRGELLNERLEPPRCPPLKDRLDPPPPRGELLNERLEPPPPPRLKDRPPPPPLNDRPPPPPPPPLNADRPPPPPPRPPPPRPPPRSPRCASASPATSTDTNKATSDHRLPKFENDMVACLPTSKPPPFGCTCLRVCPSTSSSVQSHSRVNLARPTLAITPPGADNPPRIQLATCVPFHSEVWEPSEKPDKSADPFNHAWPCCRKVTSRRLHCCQYDTYLDIVRPPSCCLNRRRSK